MDEPRPEQRRQIATAVRDARLNRFSSKLAAYTFAGVNSQTWDRIEAGESVKERSLAAVVRALWPAAGGDWRRVPGVYYMRYLTSGADDDNERVNDALGALEEVLMEAIDRITLLEQEVASLRPAQTAPTHDLAARRAAKDAEAAADAVQLADERGTADNIAALDDDGEPDER